MTSNIKSAYKIIQEGLVDEDIIDNRMLSELSLRKGYLGILTDASISPVLT